MIPFVDLKTQYLSIKDEVNAAIQGVLESCQFTLGSEVAKFEDEFAAYSGAKIGIGVNTGTSALHLALLAANVGPGDEVITVPFTFVASVAAIHYTGATPVLIDVDPKTYTMDPALLEAAITPRTKAIIVNNPANPTGKLHDVGTLEALAKLAQGQRPFATILGCSDSRDPPELIFDAVLGELFVIRVAGNVLSPEIAGSLQYAGAIREWRTGSLSWSGACTTS